MQPKKPQQPSGLDTLDVTEGVSLFTDGSSWTKDRSGGWAWIAVGIHDTEAWDSGAESDTTNNRMEMQAWIEGLLALYEAHGECMVDVFSDSEYVGLGATDLTRKRKINLDIWLVLDDAMVLHDVEFYHVKGHNGHVYNERVDKLAGEARKNDART